MNTVRKIDLNKTLQSKSCFLYGARQTGKSTLIRDTLTAHTLIQLLDPNTQRQLIQDPSSLRAMIPPHEKLVVIDEIQKVPILLDLIHLLIEEKKIKFLLTGSNARKLKRTGVNLLGGRARTRHLFPFISQELGDQYSLEKAASIGLIPSIYFSEEPYLDLKSYVSEYLIQEISAEGISRNIPSFSRFLEVAALSNSQILNYAQIGSDAGVKRGTVKNYFDILEDTLIGYRLQTWKKSKKRKEITAEKFYFFDNGIVNSLVGRKDVALHSPEGGAIFENIVLHEVRSWIEYSNQEYVMSYWRSTTGMEVDLILNDEIAIEIKAKKSLSARDFQGLKSLKEEHRFKKTAIVYLGEREYYEGDTHVLPIKSFIALMWNNFKEF